MTHDEFLHHCKDGTLPNDATDLQRSLFEDYRGDWDAAHSIAQRILTDQGSAVHAYLHRKEGDISNANYWYRRASRMPGTGPFDEEWNTLARELTDQVI